MNKNETPPTPELREPPIPNRGSPPKWKSVSALCLGAVGLFVWFVLAESVGGYAMLIGTGGYFLLSQYFLSSGNPQALRSDWPLILRLNSWILCVTVFISAQRPWLAICTVACSSAGAALAARIARH